MSSTADSYHLGLPAWAYPGWRDAYFPGQPNQLTHYAKVFNTVEGNTTFYGIPDAATVDKWYECVRGSDFKFCFKLPQSVTHERHPNWSDLDQFIEAISRLDNHIGPFLIQFPAHLEPGNLPLVERILAKLPRHFRYVLELRHPQFFEQTQCVEPILEKYRAGIVMFDSRPLYEGDRSHPEVLAGKHKKPQVPVIETVYNGVCFIRFIMHPDADSNQIYIDEWVERVTGYLAMGHEVFFMVHCPNNQHCPGFAKTFHDQLRVKTTEKDIELPALNQWPIPQQDGLF